MSFTIREDHLKVISFLLEQKGHECERETLYNGIKTLSGFELGITVGELSGLGYVGFDGSMVMLLEQDFINSLGFREQVSKMLVRLICTNTTTPAMLNTVEGIAVGELIGAGLAHWSLREFIEINSDWLYKLHGIEAN